jgi:hypothetical protein
MSEQALTQDGEVIQERRSATVAGLSDHAGSDGPEFSSEPMPAAYGALISAGIGLLLIVAAVAIFWR